MLLRVFELKVLAIGVHRHHRFSVSCHVATGPVSAVTGRVPAIHTIRIHSLLLISEFYFSLSYECLQIFVFLSASTSFYLRYSRLPCPLLPLLRPCSDEYRLSDTIPDAPGCSCKDPEPSVCSSRQWFRPHL